MAWVFTPVIFVLRWEGLFPIAKPTTLEKAGTVS